MLAGSIASGASALVLAPNEKCSVLSATPAASDTCPAAPTGLTAAAGNAQVTLSWAAPASDGGWSVTGYNVYQGTSSGGEAAAPVNSSLATTTSYTVTGLTNGTTYYFTVTAVNRVGDGEPSSEVAATPVTAPGAPTGLTATAGNTQVTLTWTAPASDGGSPVSGYNVYQGTSPGGEAAAPVNSSLATTTSYTVTGLTNGTTYYFTVTAVSAVGQSPPSAEASAALPPIVPLSSPPTIPASSVTAPTIPASSVTAPTIPASSVTAPTIPASSVTAPTIPASSVTAPTIPASSVTAPTGTAPAFAAPTGLTATAGDTQVRLSWTAPASDGGSSVISYKVYIATAPGVRQSAAIGNTKSTGATVTGLHNGTVYYFMVTAVNAAGNESPFSTEVSAKPVGPTRAVPVSLTSPTPPKQLIALLAAVAAMVAAGAFTLITRRRRSFRSRNLARSDRSRRQMAVASDVRAVPDTGWPDVVSVRDTGREPTHTIRLEPHHGVTTTMIKEGRP